MAHTGPAVPSKFGLMLGGPSQSRQEIRSSGLVAFTEF
jgi:hypothetical protein